MSIVINSSKAKTLLMFWLFSASAFLAISTGLYVNKANNAAEDSSADACLYCGGCLVDQCLSYADGTCNQQIDAKCQQAGCCGDGVSCPGQNCCTGLQYCGNGRCGTSCIAPCAGSGAPKSSSSNGCCQGLTDCPDGICKESCGSQPPPDPCAGTDHCSNGKKDCNETKTDCGGGCKACDEQLTQKPVCGSNAGSCSVGNPENITETTLQYKWDCVNSEGTVNCSKSKVPVEENECVATGNCLKSGQTCCSNKSKYDTSSCPTNSGTGHLCIAASSTSTCEDGTIVGDCSTTVAHKGERCKAAGLPGRNPYFEDDPTCLLSGGESCEDGTKIGACSTSSDHKGERCKIGLPGRDPFLDDDPTCLLSGETEKIDGLCLPTINQCKSGTFEAMDSYCYDNTKYARWKCKGIKGGIDATCSVTEGACSGGEIPKPPVEPTCGASNGTICPDGPTTPCAKGTLGNIPYLNGNNWQWICRGEGQAKATTNCSCSEKSLLNNLVSTISNLCANNFSGSKMGGTKNGACGEDPNPSYKGDTKPCEQAETYLAQECIAVDGSKQILGYYSFGCSDNAACSGTVGQFVTTALAAFSSTADTFVTAGTATQELADTINQLTEDLNEALTQAVTTNNSAVAALEALVNNTEQVATEAGGTPISEVVNLITGLIGIQDQLNEIVIDTAAEGATTGGAALQAALQGAQAQAADAISVGGAAAALAKPPESLVTATVNTAGAAPKCDLAQVGDLDCDGEIGIKDFNEFTSAYNAGAAAKDTAAKVSLGLADLDYFAQVYNTQPLEALILFLNASGTP